MRYKLRTLLIVLAIGPPLIAAACLEPIYFFALLTYFGAMASLLPVAVYLWRNSPSL